MTSGLSLIPHRTWSTNDTTELSYFDVGRLAFIPSHQAVIGWGPSGGGRGLGWVNFQTSLGIVACFGGGHFFWEGGIYEPLMARNWWEWCTSPVKAYLDLAAAIFRPEEAFLPEANAKGGKSKGGPGRSHHCGMWFSLRAVSDVKGKFIWVLKENRRKKNRMNANAFLEMLSITLLYMKQTIHSEEMFVFHVLFFLKEVRLLGHQFLEDRCLLIFSFYSQYLSLVSGAHSINVWQINYILNWDQFGSLIC